MGEAYKDTSLNHHHTHVPQSSPLTPLPHEDRKISRPISISHPAHYPSTYLHSAPHTSKTNGVLPSRPSSSYYDQYFQPTKPIHRHRIATLDGYKPGPEYQDYRAQYEQNMAAERYSDAYDLLTAKSKRSKAHGLEEYYEDRGWS